MNKNLLIPAFFALSLLLPAASALGQGAAADAPQAAPAAKGSPEIAPMRESDIPVYEMAFAPETGSMMRLLPNKAQSMQAPDDANVKTATVDVGPHLLGVVVTESKILNVMPRGEQGIAHFTASDADGKPVVARYAIITANPELKYFRAKITCAEGQTDPACGTTRLYYCTTECSQTHIIDWSGRLEPSETDKPKKK
jgi:hypothetical protein